MNLLMVFVGGGLGSMARYAISTATKGLMPFPLGTLTVNVIGSFLMGLLVTFLIGKSFSESARLMLAVGFLGGFTTFSSFSLETLMLFEKGQTLAAASNVILNLALGLPAAALGVHLAK